MGEHWKYEELSRGMEVIVCCAVGLETARELRGYFEKAKI